MDLATLITRLHEIVEKDPEAATRPVEVLTCNPSIGGSAAETVKGVHVGFDWDQGRVLLTPSRPLLSVSTETGHQPYEDVKVVGSQELPGGGTNIEIQHAGGYARKRVRMPLPVGTRLRLVALPARPGDRQKSSN